MKAVKFIFYLALALTSCQTVLGQDSKKAFADGELLVKFKSGGRFDFLFAD
jgi:hypothetical protein